MLSVFQCSQISVSRSCSPTPDSSIQLHNPIQMSNSLFKLNSSKSQFLIFSPNPTLSSFLQLSWQRFNTSRCSHQKPWPLTLLSLVICNLSKNPVGSIFKTYIKSENHSTSLLLSCYKPPSALICITVVVFGAFLFLSSFPTTQSQSCRQK